MIKQVLHSSEVQDQRTAQQATVKSHEVATKAGIWHSKGSRAYLVELPRLVWGQVLAPRVICKQCDGNGCLNEQHDDDEHRVDAQ